MRLHGWCRHCHRIRLVRVINMATAIKVGRPPIGICASCEARRDAVTIITERPGIDAWELPNPQQPNTQTDRK